MQSRLIIVLCAVGCLYAVQAKDGYGLTDEVKRDGFVELQSLRTYELMRRTYDRLYSMVGTFSVDETVALRKWLIEFGCAVQKRLHREFPTSNSEYYIEGFCTSIKEHTLKELISVVRDWHISIVEDLTETEIERLRTNLIKFLSDRTPKIMYYIEQKWTNFNDKRPARIVTEATSFQKILKDLLRKLHVIADSPWMPKHIELNRMIVKIIKRADDELIKNDEKKWVEKLIERMPYESLDTLPLQKLVREFKLRVEDLLTAVWTSESATYNNNLIEFFKTSVEEIVKYTRIE